MIAPKPKKSPFRFSMQKGRFSFRKRPHMPLDDHQGDSRALIADSSSYGYSDEGRITTTLDSGVLLVEVSWRSKEYDPLGEGGFLLI